MNNPFETHGAFSWTELMTTDVPAARKFYGQLLGWKLRDMEGGPMPYTIVNAADQDIGGIMATPPEVQGKMPAAWGTYVTVKDVDAVLAKVPGLGGRVIVAAKDLPGVGRMAVIMDPQGATISFITYKMRT